MDLLVQLRAEDAPEGVIAIPGKAILQVFHCGTGRCDHGEVTRAPGGTGVRMRIVSTVGGKQTAAPTGSVLGHRIVDLISAEELPDAAADLQGPAGPACATCDLPMRFALQLQHDDAGLAYLHQCPKHPMQLAFSWSST
jgi:hypothetical protein